ncbi:MAG: hypothetical protein ABJV68_31875 [Paracoccaceae bacterium]|uniref:Uncharacterized protein n=1 Tax=Henriciella pelagia TaxID=1977912 RepID=A0ABQ1JVW0_9PROT|nr:hypothetical protein GCM10011503_30390 [Henriciella pelagia]
MRQVEDKEPGRFIRDREGLKVSNYFLDALPDLGAIEIVEQAGGSHVPQQAHFGGCYVLMDTMVGDLGVTESLLFNVEQAGNQERQVMPIPSKGNYATITQ